MPQRSNVCPPAPLEKGTFQLKLAAAWSRVCNAMGGQSAMATKMGLTDTSAIKRGTGMKNLPEAHTIFNSLLADETAMNEVLAYYGFCLTRTHSDAANDLSTAAGTIDAMAALIRSQDDHVRDHNETLAIAQLLRPHMGALNGIIDQADRLRGAA